MFANSSRDSDLPSGVGKRAVVVVLKNGVGVVGLVQGWVSTARVVAREARAGSTVSSSAGSHASIIILYNRTSFIQLHVSTFFIGIPGR